VMRVEGGELVEGYREARKLIDRRPEAAEAHFTLSYVLRYAGLLRESARECNTAWSLDPSNRDLRSCSLTFLMIGDYDRARDFLEVDAGTAWSRFISAEVLIREGRTEEAVRIVSVPNMANPRARLMRARYGSGSQEEIDRLAGELVASARARRDSEPSYHASGMLAASGKIPEARQMLREAVQRNFCAYPAMDTDPLLAPLRADPSFQQLREEAIACQQRFLRERS
jgi:tetratricopeptide (TPR) repeat protein